MKIENLKIEKERLEQSREQAIAQVNQITGAISMLDKLILDLDKENTKDEEPSKELKK